LKPNRVVSTIPFRDGRGSGMAGMGSFWYQQRVEA